MASKVERVGRVGRLRAQAPALAALGLFAAVFVILGLDATVSPPREYDEGTILSYVLRMTQGELPYRDFELAYGPAEPAILYPFAAAWGPELILLRMLRAASMAGLVALAAACCWRLGSRSGALLAAAGVLHFVSPFYNSALVLTLASVFACDRALRGGGGIRPRPLVLAGGLAGLAALFRLEVGVLSLCCCASMLASSWLLGADPGRRAHLASSLRLLLLGAAPALAAYVILVALVGLEFFEMFGMIAASFEYYTLPYPLPPNARLPLTARLELWVGAGLPPVVALAGPAVLTRRSWRFLRGHCSQPDPLLFGLVVAQLGFMPYALRRADSAHLYPAFVISCVLACSLLGHLERRLTKRRLIALCLVLSLAPLAVAVRRTRSSLETRRGTVTSRQPGLWGICLPEAREQAYARSNRIVDMMVGPDEPIFIGCDQHRRIVMSDPFAYVMYRRPIATRHHVFCAGTTNMTPKQEFLVRELEAKRPKLVVLVAGGWRPEPNRSREMGSPVLDEWLRANYRVVAKNGRFAFLKPRRPQ